MKDLRIGEQYVFAPSSKDGFAQHPCVGTYIGLGLVISRDPMHGARIGDVSLSDLFDPYWVVTDYESGLAVANRRGRRQAIRAARNTILNTAMVAREDEQTVVDRSRAIAVRRYRSKGGCSVTGGPRHV